MAAQGGGRIINIGSEQLNEAFPGIAPNVAGKAAALGLSRCLVAELGPGEHHREHDRPRLDPHRETHDRDTPDNPYITGTPLRRMCEPE